VLSHRAALPLSRQALACVTGVIRRDLAAIGSGWRKLPPVCSIHAPLIGSTGSPQTGPPAGKAPGARPEPAGHRQPWRRQPAESAGCLPDQCTITSYKLSAGPLMCWASTGP